MKPLKLILLVTFFFLFTACSTPSLFSMSESDRIAELETREREAFEAAEELRRIRVRHGLQERDLVLGMQMSDVRNVWGEPRDVQMAGDPRYGNQRWIYFEGLSSPWSTSRARIVYFENGRVVGWETQ